MSPMSRADFHRAAFEDISGDRTPSKLIYAHGRVVSPRADEPLTNFHDVASPAAPRAISIYAFCPRLRADSTRCSTRTIDRRRGGITYSTPIRRDSGRKCFVNRRERIRKTLNGERSRLLSLRKTNVAIRTRSSANRPRAIVSPVSDNCDRRRGNAFEADLWTILVKMCVCVHTITCCTHTHTHTVYIHFISIN